MLRRLLLLPLLAPVLAALVVAAINPRPAIALRLLTWRSPALPLGAWIALAASGGALLSASASGLALREGAGTPLRRRVRAAAGEAWSQAEVWPEVGRSASRPESGRSEPGPAEATPPWRDSRAAGPARAPGEPAPTVEVPFRVIRRASASAAPPPRAAAAAGSGKDPEPVPVSVPLDDWGREMADDW